MSATSNSLIISTLLHLTIVVPLVLAMPNMGEVTQGERRLLNITIRQPHVEVKTPVEQPKQIVEQPKQAVVEVVSSAVREDQPPAVVPKDEVVVKQRVQRVLLSTEMAAGHEVVTQPQQIVKELVAVVEQPPIKKSGEGKQQSVLEVAEINLIAKRYRERLLGAITREKRYPKRAQRLGLEGEVVVGFTVKLNGQIVDIALVESSEYGHLDRAAIKAIEKVGQLEPIPTLLGREQWAFQVPLQYSLN